MRQKTGPRPKLLLKPFGIPCASADLMRSRSPRHASGLRGATQRRSRRSTDASPNTRNAPVPYAKRTNVLHINNPELAAVMTNTEHLEDPAATRSTGGTAPKPLPRDSWVEPDMRLVEDDRAPAPVLDGDVLPAGWEHWTCDEAEARGCPRDYIASGLIGAASAWIGNARRIAATADWIEPAHLWFALIGAPSAGKSPALRPMIEASRALEREAEPAWREALAQYERDAEAARA